jgi:hypothetical protein
MGLTVLPGVRRGFQMVHDGGVGMGVSLYNDLVNIFVDVRSGGLYSSAYDLMEAQLFEAFGEGSRF